MICALFQRRALARLQREDRRKRGRSWRSYDRHDACEKWAMGEHSSCPKNGSAAFFCHHAEPRSSCLSNFFSRSRENCTPGMFGPTRRCIHQLAYLAYESPYECPKYFSSKTVITYYDFENEITRFGMLHLRQTNIQLCLGLPERNGMGKAP